MKVIIPFKTPTVNHIYFTWNNRRILTKKARDLKKEIKDIVQKNTCGLYDITDQKLKVITKIYEDWYCKNGSVKKKDIANREKFLIDSVFDALDLDDKFIFEHKMIKIQNTKEEKAVIEIKAI